MEMKDWRCLLKYILRLFILAGDLAKSIRSKTDMHFGLYHSLGEWFNPLSLEDQKNNFSTNYFPHVNVTMS